MWPVLPAQKKQVSFHPMTLVSSLFHLLLFFALQCFKGRSRKLGNWKGLLHLGKCKYHPFWLQSGMGEVEIEKEGTSEGKYVGFSLKRFCPTPCAEKPLRILYGGPSPENPAAMVLKSLRNRMFAEGISHRRWAYYKSASMWEGPTVWEKQQTQWMKGPASEKTIEQSTVNFYIRISALW